MRPRNLILVAAAGAALAVPLSRITLAQGQSEPRRPDADHGAAIAARGTAAGAVACAQCHAFNGISDASGAFPRIAIVLRSEKGGRRSVEIDPVTAVPKIARLGNVTK